MTDLKRLLRYLGPYRRDMVIGALLVVIETAFELFIPLLMADLIDVGVKNHDVPYILQQGVYMGICALLSLVTGLLYARFAARAAYGWGARIREVQYQKVQGFAFSNLDHFESSSLVTRMTTDVTVLQNAVNGGFRPMVRGPVMLVMGVGLSFWMNPTLALVFLVCAPLLGAALFYILRKIAPLYSLLQRAVDRLNGVVQEGLTAIRAVKAFVRGEYEEEKFQEVNTSLMETSQKTFQYAVLNLPAFQLVMYVCVILIMWFGGNMILNSTLQVGELTGFLSYVFQVMNSMMMISNVFLLLTRSLASAHRIGQVLEEQPAFSTPEQPVGQVRGRDVRDYDLRALRDAVGIVLQKNVLFSGTIRENLLWGNPEADDDTLWEACRKARADEFIERLPKGMDTDLGQGGVNVSGGQKQRLCIARTLLKKPKVLIFDDSTSAVDTATEGEIREALAKLTDVTKIIIAQRITSVMDTDQIIILDDGRIHGTGTHRELLEKDSIYQEIYASQMKGEED